VALAELVAVKQLPMLGIAGGLLAAASLCLAFGLYDLGQRRAAAPAVVAVEKTNLAEALDDAPYVSSRGDGPVLWLVTAPDCAPCRAFERKVLPGLLDRGVEVRVILAAPREARIDAGEAQWIAAVARRREWVSLHKWMTGGAAQADVSLEAPAAEGYLEWGRASFERIDGALHENGLALAAPALFWRVGPEWRASVKPDERAIKFLRDDLAPAD
jgi:hypothetical protein